MIAFGIDPGSVRTGWGIVESEGSRLRCIDFGVIAMRDKDALSDRLRQIFEELSELLGRAAPDEIFLEAIFHHQNAKSALVLGHARGVALLAASRAQRPVLELSPAEVKKAVAGSGRADKHQVQEMIRIQLGLRDRAPVDASDALAIAIAGATRSRFARLLGEVR
jgi:crossover junction endodeoxyribonuclease RuvC